MTRQEKEKVVDFLSDEFSKAQAVVVCNYSGVTVKNLESLRIAARAVDTKVQVAKNTLATIAFEKSGTKDIKLTDTNIFIWGEDQINTSKVAANFASTNETFEIKSGIIEKEIVDKSMIESLSKLPGKDELLGMLLSVWTAPTRNFVTGLDNLREKKENEQ